MQIREATEKDIPGILKVLKASLGEISSRKTEEVWRFKHIDNPFGGSMVLLAVEEEEIIGVRAFMRWKWQKGKEIFSAFRAVDTATHPAHQGKGIFKKLTLKALETAKKNGDHFVFNTPNEQSKPGYLKMGWKEIARLKVGIRPVNPIYWKRPAKTTDSSVDQNRATKTMEEFLEAMNKQLAKEEKVFTPKTLEFLNWRYKNNPLQRYEIKTTEDLYIAGYIKTHRKYRELRIVEVIADSVSERIVKQIIRSWGQEFGVQFISFAPNVHFHFKFSISGNFGPVFTLRNINLPEQMNQELLNLNNWAYSLGDLELF